MIPSMSVIKNVYFQILYLNMIRFSIILSCDRQVVLLQEVERWNRLVERMADSLFQLRRALAGKLGIYCLKVLIICKHIMNEVCQLIGLKCNWFLSKLPRAAPFVKTKNHVRSQQTLKKPYIQVFFVLKQYMYNFNDKNIQVPLCIHKSDIQIWS